MGHVSSARTGRATGFTDAQELLFGQYPVLTLFRDRKGIHLDIPGILWPRYNYSDVRSPLIVMPKSRGSGFFEPAAFFPIGGR